MFHKILLLKLFLPNTFPLQQGEFLFGGTIGIVSRPNITRKNLPSDEKHTHQIIIFSLSQEARVGVRPPYYHSLWNIQLL